MSSLSEAMNVLLREEMILRRCCLATARWAL